MSWAALATTATHMKEREAEYFTGMADAAIIALKQTIAKDQMKRDLCDELGMELTDTAVDTIATDYESDLQRALALLQLHLIFTDQDAGEGSVNRFKSQYYRSAYDNEKRRFKTMGAAATSSSISVTTRWL